jgi:tRNA-splicing ligase RtcB
MSEGEEVIVRSWLGGPMPPDVASALARLAESDGVRRIAVMPDAHLAADVCIGTVVATGGTLYPNAVGGDIGCGVAALAFDVDAAAVANEQTAARVLASFYAAMPVVRHGRSRGRGLPAALAARRLSAPVLETRAGNEAGLQLGTLGRGNHFVELQADEEGRLWLMLHSGSRGIGQAIRDHHLARARPARGGLRCLDAESDLGQSYLADLQWALDYADASRAAMVEAVREVLFRVVGACAEDGTYVACNHNHVRQETHAGERLWVHRKGAISAAAGEPGLVPGSMGSRSVHVTGRGNEEALSSSAHGAGRRLSRSEARRQLSARDVLRELRGVLFDHRMASALREEAPSAYKDIDQVLRAQHELVRIVRRLRPVLCFKGG